MNSNTMKLLVEYITDQNRKKREQRAIIHEKSKTNNDKQNKESNKE